MKFVLDASVVIKWYLEEELLDRALKLKDKIGNDGANVAVPRLFFVEAANVLWKKVILGKSGGLKRSDAKGIFSRILDLPFHVIEEDEILLKALDLSVDYKISIYDAMYVASALRFKAQLVTADTALEKKLVGLGLSNHVKHLGDF